VILAKYRPAGPRPAPASAPAWRWADYLFQVPARVQPAVFWARVLAFLCLAVWGWRLAGLSVAEGEMNGSFAHAILIPFHEAGHVIFRPFGEFLMYLGGTLGQLLMPAVLIVALLRQNGDAFGASLGLWLLGVSLLDIAPYMYDALHPRLMLLTGGIGVEGGHDWIFVFVALGWVGKAQTIARATWALGVAVLALANAWGAYMLYCQRQYLAED
jgi:hypothetical protein